MKREFDFDTSIRNVTAIDAAADIQNAIGLKQFSGTVVVKSTVSVATDKVHRLWCRKSALAVQVSSNLQPSTTIGGGRLNILTELRHAFPKLTTMKAQEFSCCHNFKNSGVERAGEFRSRRHAWFATSGTTEQQVSCGFRKTTDIKVGSNPTCHSRVSVRPFLENYPITGGAMPHLAPCRIMFETAVTHLAAFSPSAYNVVKSPRQCRKMGASPRLATFLPPHSDLAALRGLQFPRQRRNAALHSRSSYEPFDYQYAVTAVVG